MSMASMSNPSLYSSPPFPRAKPTKQSLSFLCVFAHSTSRLTLSSHDHPSAVAAGGQAAARPLALTVRVSSSATEPQPSKSGDGEDAGGQEGEVYEVELDKPYGLRFFKGRDGGTYIDAIAPEGAADKTGLFTVGDKVIATSAVFGTEIWPAAEYGRTMYTIRQRIGPLLMKMEKRYGKLEDGGELTEKEIIRAERNSGFISNRVREIQMQNYVRKVEQKERREQDLREGLKLYKFR